MLEEKKQVALNSILIVDGDNSNKSSLELLIDSELSDKKITDIKDLITVGKDVKYYLLQSIDNQYFSGYVIISPYNKVENSKEIYIKLVESLRNENVIKEVIRYFINLIAEDVTVENICIKVENSNKLLTSVLEEIGFMKEGLFISNQFKQGEFTYHTVYKYKLV